MKTRKSLWRIDDDCSRWIEREKEKRENPIDQKRRVDE